MARYSLHIQFCIGKYKNTIVKIIMTIESVNEENFVDICRCLIMSRKFSNLNYYIRERFKLGKYFSFSIHPLYHESFNITIYYKGNAVSIMSFKYGSVYPLSVGLTESIVEQFNKEVCLYILK